MGGGNFVSLFAVMAFLPSMGDATIDVDTQLSSDMMVNGTLYLKNGAKLDLNGHNLKVSHLTAEEGTDGAYVTNSVAGVKPVLWAANVSGEAEFIDFQKVTVHADSLTVRVVNEGDYASAGINLGSAVDAEFVQTGDNVSVTSAFKLGTRAGVKGTYEMTGGTLTLSFLYKNTDTDIGIGFVTGGIGNFRAGGNSTVNLNSSALLIGTATSATGRVEIADNVKFTISRTGGKYGGWVNIAHAANSCGEMALSGGTLTVQNDFNVGVGSGSVATCDMSGGTLSVNGFLYTARPGSKGVFNMSGGTVNAANQSYVGRGSGAVGTFNMGGGMVTANSHLWVGKEGGTGVFNMNNGTLTVNGSLVPGSNGTGSFFQGGGTVNANYFLTIGHGNGGNGSYVITNGALVVNNQQSIIGQVSSESRGLLDVAGGEAVIAKGICLGYTTGASGTLRVRNGGRLVTSTIFKGDSSATAVEFDGGTVVATNEAGAAFLSGIPTVAFGAGGVTFDTAGHDIGVANCVLKVTPGVTAIRLTGGGTCNFANTTLDFTDRLTDGFVFAQVAENDAATFTGVPMLAEGINGGYKVQLSADGKCCRVVSRGLVVIVK